MNFTIQKIFLMISLLVASGFATLTASSQRPTVIPKLKGIQIDGDPLDWGDAGFRVDVLSDQDGKVLPIHDFDVSFRLGWHGQGLVILAAITDDIRREAGDTPRLWVRDSLDIFLADHVGSHNFYQLTVATGENEGTVTKKIHDRRHGVDTGNELTAEVALDTSGNITIVEAFLPWSNLGIEPEIGATFGFQFMAHDDDGPGDRSLRLVWFPGSDTHYDPHKMFSLMLGHQSSQPTDVIVRRLSRIYGTRLEVIGLQKYAARTIEIEHGSDQLIEAVFQNHLDRAAISIDLEPIDDETFSSINVFMDGLKIASFPALPTASFLIEEYIDATGGKDALHGINTLKCTGLLIHDLCYKTPQIEEIPVELSFILPSSFHMSQLSSDRNQREGCDENAAWKMDGDVVTHVHREDLSVLRLILNPHHSLNMIELYPEMIVRCRTVRDGHYVYQVEAKFGKGNHHEIFFDAESGLIVRWNHMHLEDYREVSGALLPFRIWTGRKGGKSSFVFDHVAQNVELDRNAFAMPNPKFD